MLQAVIFDMDGLIADTEKAHSKSYERILNEHGIKPVLNKYGLVQTVGVHEEEQWPKIKNTHNLEGEIPALMERRSKHFLDLLDQVEPMPGLFEILTLLQKHNLKIGLASSSVIRHVDEVVDVLGIRKYFEVILSAQFVPSAKPAPDVFLETAKQLNVKTANCLVLEDSQSGVTAARRANMHVIAIPNIFTSGHDFSDADMVVQSLHDVTWDVIRSF